MTRTSSWRAKIAVLAASAALASPHVALADRADDLFREAVELAKADKADAAYQKLLEAWSLKQSYDIAANLGGMERKLGKHKEAVEHLEFALKNFPPSVDVAVRERIQADIAASKKEIGAVDVACPANTKLFLNGKPVGEGPNATILLEPGTYELSGAHREKGGAVITLKVDKGQTLAITLDLQPGKGPKLPDDGSTPGTPPPGEAFPLWPGLLVGGVGVASLGAGLGLALAAGSAGSEADELTAGLESRSACLTDPKPEVCNTIQDDLETRDALTAGSIATFAIGGALLATGAVLIAVSATSGGPSDEKPAGPTVTAFAPWFSPDGAGVFLGLAF